MLIVLSIELIMLIGAVTATKLTNELDSNAEQILAKQVENRKGYMEQFLLNAEDVSLIANYVNSEMQKAIDAGELDPDNIDSMSSGSTEFMRKISGRMISFMRIKSVTGAFVVFNTQDLDTLGDGGSFHGIYLRDLDPDAVKSERNEDLTYIIAPPKVVQSMRIYTDSSWQPTFRYNAESGEFIYRPFQEAYNDNAQLDAKDYGRWTTKAFTLPNDTKRIITYSEPLILPNGTVYGVIGIELLESYVIKKLPVSELQNDKSGIYALAYVEESDPGQTFNVVICSHYGSEDDFSHDKLTLDGESEGLVETNDVRYYVSTSPLRLYSRNTPFSSEEWQIIGMIPDARLFEMSNRVRLMMTAIIMLTFTAGLIGSIVVGKQLSRPVKKLSDEVAEAQTYSEKIPVLSRTGISELDSFAEAFTKISQEILDTSTKFLRIMNMASYELGGYEIRLENTYVYLTDNFFSMLGISAPEKNLTADAFTAVMRSFTESTPNFRDPSGGIVYRISQPDGGSVRYIRLRVTVEKAFQIGLVEDATAQTLERQRIEHERDYDSLTGLRNRSSFHNQCVALLANNSELGYGAFLMMDLDNLKSINDKYGHSWGDRYINLAGKFISANFPENSLSSRQSSDEFVAFVYGYEDQETLSKELDELSAKTRNYILKFPDGTSHPVSISCGVAWYPGDSRDLKTLQKYADFAMYQVKKSTKGVIGTFDVAAYNHEMFEVQLRREFFEVLDEQKLFYFLQPIFSAKTGEAEAYEALMRVDMPTLKTPLEVLHLAKKLNRLYDIEYLTFFKATETFVKHRESGSINPHARLFINSISNIVLSEADWKKFKETYPEEVIDDLVVELLESEELDYHALEIKREFLKKYKGDFALDDYGVGYSNSYTLLELSPSFIKIDMSIIRGIDSDENKREIVRGIVEYAHPRDMRIVAEGIENADELRCVIGLGVDLLQGYYLGHPAILPGAISDEAFRVINEMKR